MPGRNRTSRAGRAYWHGLKESLPKLARKHGTPLFIVSRTLLLEQLVRFRKLLPRVEPFYAVKANPCPDVIRTLAEAGCGFDVASMPEIQWALDTGADPERLIFANTVKREPSIRYAAERGVRMMTFDSEYELTKIARHAPGARVLVRIKVPNVGSAVELSLKFGVDPADAVPLLIKAKKLGLEPCGVSFHVGSQCTDGDNYLEAFELAKIITSDAQLRQLPLAIVDIGGGFPIRYFDSEEDWFSSMAPAMNLEINRLFDQNLRIIAEPGRVLVGPSAVLLMSVIGKSIRSNKHWYFLDDGVYGCLSGIVFDHGKYQFEVLKKGPTQLTTIAGPTCDSLDIISSSEELPELDFGDLVFAKNVGAYSIAHATNFNGLPLAKAVMVP